MKPPSLGVDFSNQYLAELRKQGLTAAEANKKLYERDREMPDELVISLMLYCYDLETGKPLWGYAIQSPFAWKDYLFVTPGAGGEDHRPIVAIRAGGSRA